VGLTSADAPTFGAKVVHQFNGTFDEVGGLIEFFDRLGSIRACDHETITPGVAVVADLVPQAIAVSVEEPNHRVPARLQQGGRLVVFNERDTRQFVARVPSLSSLSGL
jgi:hypothetical protein